METNPTPQPLQQQTVMAAGTVVHLRGTAESKRTLGVVAKSHTRSNGDKVVTVQWYDGGRSDHWFEALEPHTPQPSDVGEVERLLYEYHRQDDMHAFYRCRICKTQQGEPCKQRCPVPAVLAAVRTLAGERDAAQRATQAIQDQWTRDVTLIANQRDDAQARESRMREWAQAAYDVIEQGVEINPSNYDHDDVCRLNDAMIEVYHILETALAGAGESDHE